MTLTLYPPPDVAPCCDSCRHLHRVDPAPKMLWAHDAAGWCARSRVAKEGGRQWRAAPDWCDEHAVEPKTPRPLAARRRSDAGGRGGWSASPIPAPAPAGRPKPAETQEATMPDDPIDPTVLWIEAAPAPRARRVGAWIAGATALMIGVVPARLLGHPAPRGIDPFQLETDR